MKPMQWLAIVLTLAALILYIISLSSASWVRVDNAGSNFKHGPFRSCGRIWAYQIDECRRVDNDCNADFSAPLGDMAIFGDCDRLRAVRALGVIALFSTLFALLPLLATAYITHDLALRLTSAFWSFLAFACGLVCMAIFAAEDLPPRSLYGYAFGLVTTAWILNMISCLTALFPSPITLPATADMVKGAPVAGMQHDAAYGVGPAGYNTARPSLSTNTYPQQAGTTMNTGAPAQLV